MPAFSQLSPASFLSPPLVEQALPMVLKTTLGLVQGGNEKLAFQWLGPKTVNMMEIF